MTKDTAKPAAVSALEASITSRQDLAHAVYSSESFDRTLPPSVVAMLFSTSKQTLEYMRNTRQSLILETSPQTEGVRVILVGQVPDNSVNFVQSLFDEDYRAKLVSGWYKRLSRVFQNPDQRAVFDEVSEVFAEASQPLGLEAKDEINLPGMFDFAYPEGEKSSVRNHIDALRELIQMDAISTEEYIHVGLSQVLDKFWPIVTSIAPTQIKSQGLYSPDQLRDSSALNGVQY